MGSIYIYAPGVAPPWGGCEKAVKDVCRATKNLHIFSPHAQLKTYIDTASRIAIVTDAERTHTVYIPLFVDFHSKTGLRDRYIAQKRDIADLYYVHAYASLHHEGPIHMLGHSRGGGTVMTYAGLLWYDPDCLHELAHNYWPESAADLMHDMQCVDARARSKIGMLCPIGAFDNLGETLRNVFNALYLPEFVQRYVTDDLPSLYHRISSLIPVPQYDWETNVTPRAMAAYIPRHIACVCVHTDRDPINPPEVARDIHAVRAEISPDRSYIDIIENRTTLPFRHLEVPYFRDVAEVGNTIRDCMQCMEREFYSHT